MKVSRTTVLSGFNLCHRVCLNRVLVLLNMLDFSFSIVDILEASNICLAPAPPDRLNYGERDRHPGDSRVEAQQLHSHVEAQQLQRYFTGACENS